MSEDAIFYGLEGPLDAVPGKGQMRAANLRGFSDFARGRGRDARAILERTGIDMRALGDPDSHVGAQALVDTFEYCSTLFEDPLFGLHFAQGQDAEVFGCITALARAAADLRTAIDALVSYLPIIHSPEAAPELVEGERSAELRWGVVHDLGVNDQANLQAVVLQMKLLRQLGGADFSPRYVQLAIDPRPCDVAEIERVVGCRLHVRAPVNAIGFQRAHLDLPLASSNRLLYRLLGGYLDRVRSANRITFTQRVRDYIRGDLPKGHCTIERAAERFAVSVRTLQGRLAEEQTSFSAMVEDVRRTLAQSYLRRPDASLDEIAEWLGYGEQTSFGRAFKRWTGTTPQKYRQDLKV
ncbi:MULTISPECIES: helix-turn-helix transcriptional regulator [Novosphingobium]|uniref:AraC family transcriptional regulator ligand-binding domain-containing protein n=1 Tax=Novosphingobium decolorationis TaxID=2698673 RepID=A0ABX8E6W3_9SPHN|nr:MULTISPECIES: AraC family transcriptional regulator [Novosphingobium]QVM84685.1 AraC family transcriptional regulator ligand-binding domain-containing protein [Novosphingobium decolorationis]GAM04264.1 AraC family transcriptional regulator [Novosphingobium sp. MBES04]